MPYVPFRNDRFRYPAVNIASTKYSPMAERPREHVGVEECKRFTPPIVPNTSASTTRLPLGFLDLDIRVPDTGTATSSRRRLTESQISASLATKRVRHAQRTEGQRLNDARERPNGELGNSSSRQTKMHRRRRRRLYRLSMKK